MILKTETGERIEVIEEPRYSEFHNRWYVAGRRWIKSKQKFSSNVLVHNAKQFTPEE